MRNVLSILLFLCTIATATAQRITREYNNVSLSEALRGLNAETSDYEINFLYNELEDFRITTSVHRKSVPDAIRQMIGFYPIRMSVDGQEIIVECLQKTAPRYKGNIVDEHGQPVAYANIAILSPQDSTLITGGVSNENGLFVIPCEQHPVLARISYVGYKTIYKRCKTENVGTIQMQPDNIKLNTVKVTGNSIQNTTSGYKVNIRALQYAKDRMLTDVLPYLPGINIDEKQITILGNVVTAYYIDGIRTTNPDALKSLSSDRIETIEVDYLAGADEAKSAVGGIIRITTRREANGGYSGDVRGSMQLQPSNGISNKKLSNSFSASIGNLYLFNNLSMTRNTPKIHEENSYMPKSNINEGYTTDMQRKHKRSYLNEYFGMNYEINKSQQVKGSVWYEYADEGSDETELTERTDGKHISTQHASKLTHIVQGVADYVWKQKAGQQFDFIIDYLYRYQQDRLNSTLDNMPNDDMSQVQNTHMLRIQPKWQQPLSKSVMLTTGLDYQQTNYKNDLQNKTTMNSHAPAAFAQLKGRTKALMYEAGLRVQFTNMEVMVADINNAHNDFGIYPTINLMWMMNKKQQHMLNLMYKYSMEDLPYSVVSSYRSYTSPYSYETGNPELSAPTGHELIMMGRLWGRLTLMGGYLRANDVIYFVREQSPESPAVTQIKPYNCAYVDGIMLGAEYLLRVGNLWTGKPRVQLKKMAGEVNSSNYSNPISFTFDWRNDFRFSPTFSGNLNFHYESTSHYLDHTLKPVWHVNLQLTKSFFKEHLLLGLEAMPIVKNRRSITDNLNVKTIYSNLTKEQYLSFSVTWRFKGGKHLREQSTAGSLQIYKQFEKEK